MKIRENVHLISRTPSVRGGPDIFFSHQHISYFTEGRTGSAPVLLKKPIANCGRGWGPVPCPLLIRPCKFALIVTISLSSPDFFQTSSHMTMSCTRSFFQNMNLVQCTLLVYMTAKMADPVRSNGHPVSVRTCVTRP